jgi:hypothetical protein
MRFNNFALVTLLVGGEVGFDSGLSDSRVLLLFLLCRIASCKIECLSSRTSSKRSV